MSGHSKWAQIKRQKEVNDQKRGQIFTKMAKAITIAVKQGGGITDPDSNFRLRLAIDLARSVNMPKENIERAIKRASGKEAASLSEVVYEGFAPGGFSVMVEAATDNIMRTTAEVKGIFNKYGGIFAQPGSVSYQFKQVGRIIVKKNEKTFDDIFTIAVDNGADDIEEVGDEVFIYVPVNNISKMKDVLSAAGLEIVEAGSIRKPIIPANLTDKEQIEKLNSFVNALEDLDDVLNVYTNT
jgi:YebC/PmpR family DNA-binding regulatory protein